MEAASRVKAENGLEEARGTTRRRTGRRKEGVARVRVTEKGEAKGQPKGQTGSVGSEDRAAPRRNNSYCACTDYGYMEDDLMEIDLKSLFRAISSLENWIMI